MLDTCRKMIDVSCLPKDVCLGSVKLILTGMQEVWIGNYKGILKYTSENIMLQAKHEQLCIEGKNLTIAYYTEEDMKITGHIMHIYFL